MKKVLFAVFAFICIVSCSRQNSPMYFGAHTDSLPNPPTGIPTYTYLALGDSYTIGESVALSENFPNQTATLLARDTVYLKPPRIIARTGWTTSELKEGIRQADQSNPISLNYDFVSLLIGVNNQYRGYPINTYATEFEELLQQAIRYAGNRPERVIVLSIPDWGVTPFANGRDRALIAQQIDEYNHFNREIARRYNVEYLDITPWTREAATDPGLLAPDGLHPSAREYRRWAERIAVFFRSKI